MVNYRSDFTSDTVRQVATLADLPQGDEIMTTLADRLRKEGYELGIEQGTKRGTKQERVQNTQKNILQILHIRFQNIPDNVVARLKTIKDSDILSQLLEKVVTAVSLNDFDEQLRQYAY